MIWSLDASIREWLPKLQSHRGYWVDGQLQNSLAAVQQAYAQHYEMCEFDVRMTSDQNIILFHDAKFRNKFISDTSLSDLQSEIEITTLRDLLLWFKSTVNFKLNIEIKNESVLNLEIEKKVCSLIQELELFDRILISSFNPVSLGKVKFFEPRLKRALLMTFENEHGNNWIVKSGILNYICKPHVLHIRYQDFVKQKIFYKNLSKKIPIVMWTVNNFEIYLENRDFVHGIISDQITPTDFRVI